MDVPDPNSKNTFETISENQPNPTFNNPEMDAGYNLFDKTFDLVASSLRIRQQREELYRLNSLAGLAGIHQDFYHYTTAEGIQGIIENGCLFVTSGYFLNDSSEVDYGCQMFGAMLSKWCNEHRDENIGTLLLNALEMYSSI
jgi:hypothetical protein